MPNLCRIVYFLCGPVVLLAACSGPAAPPSIPGDTPRPLSTPFAREPTAGICGESAGAEVLLVLEPGIPDPRCSIVRSSQVLRVVNHTGGAVAVTLGRETIALALGAEAAFATPFGQALLPGVHLVLVDPCCGGELWLKGN